jgi:hypothetical protein
LTSTNYFVRSPGLRASLGGTRAKLVSFSIEVASHGVVLVRETINRDGVMLSINVIRLTFYVLRVKLPADMLVPGRMAQ